jgi:hypothetical protein
MNIQTAAIRYLYRVVRTQLPVIFFIYNGNMYILFRYRLRRPSGPLSVAERVQNPFWKHFTVAKQSRLEFLKQQDAGTLQAAEDVLGGGKRTGFLARLVPFLGPAFIASVAYLVETILDKPESGSVLYHSVVPQFSGPESVLLATGILGATVMSHAIFLHSALTQGRIIVKDPVRARRLFHEAKADLIVLGTHGKTGTNAFWSGNTAPRVCAGCDVPILLVPVTQ